jgi:hypothetical protein
VCSVDADVAFLVLSSRHESCEGASGYTPEPSSPASEETAPSVLTKEQEEVRRRRIEKFGQTQTQTDAD